MSGLLADGDRTRHLHDLPPVPTEQLEFNDATGKRVEQTRRLVNAVAQCPCGQLFVTRDDPDAWGDGVDWRPLRWWHRRAIAKLRVLQAARIGGVAE